jgi:phosphate-selective porin
MAVRYDYLSVGSPALEPFAGTPGVANSSAPAIGGAGREQAVTLGLNWYLCPNARWLWNYSHAFRDVPNPAASGDVDALGTRVIFDF